MNVFALIALLASPALAHLALFHPSMYGFKPDNPWAYEQTNPLADMLFKDWWFHGYINEPPADGVFMELPAGGSFLGEIGCSKDVTSFGGKNNESDAPPLPLMACDKAGEKGQMGNIHATDLFPGPALGQSKSVKGSALGIAYQSDVGKIKPEDFVVISVNHSSPWTREVEFQIPAGLPACPEGGCHCMWGWVPDSYNVQQMYTLGYRCKVTGEVGTQHPAQPQVPRKCPFDKNNCTSGAKQLLFIDQAEGNNINQAHVDPAVYNYEYGFHDGAQIDIWSTDDGATWNTNTSDLAPAPWSTTINTWITTPDSRGGPSGAPKPPVDSSTPPVSTPAPNPTGNTTDPMTNPSMPSAADAPNAYIASPTSHLPSSSAPTAPDDKPAQPTVIRPPKCRPRSKRRLAE